MIDISPFESLLEHKAYCEAAYVPFEENSFGFKIFENNDKLGLCQLQTVGNAAYLLTLKAIDGTITTQILANLFVSVAEFLLRIGITSIVYPIQDDNDVEIAMILGFDRVSETLFVFDFPSESEDEDDNNMGS